MCVCLGINTLVSAQRKDTSRVDLVLLQKKQDWEQNPQDSTAWQSPDTSLNNFHYHYPSFYNLNSFLGYLGTPTQQLNFRNQNTSGLSLNYDQLDAYRLNSRSTPNYQLSKPLTQAFYVWSTRREEFFNLTHSQNLSEQLNVSAKYRRISNQGWFERQILTFNGVNINTNYSSKSGRYAFKASASYNNNLSQESGGYSAIDELAGVDPLLSNAESKSRTQDFAFQQRFRLGPMQVDTVFKQRNDSIQDTVINKTVISTQSLVQDIRFRRGFYEFQDSVANQGVYPGVYDPNVTDKQDLIVIDHNFAWEKRAKKDRYFLRLGMLNQYFGLIQGPDGSVQNEYLNNHIIPELQLNFSPLLLNFKVDYGLTGYTQNDLRVQANARVKLNEKWLFNAGLDLDTYEPQYFLSNYQQAQYQWDIDLPKTEHLQIFGGFTSETGDYLKISYSLINDYAFLNSSLRPEVWAPEISLLQAELSKTFELKPFYLNLRGVYQLSDASDVLGIPDYIIFTSLYYEHTLFKKNMLARIGTDIYYTSRFQPYSFFPLMRQFYQQGGFTTGAYPLIDIYFAAQVKTARFFIKGTNIYQAVSGTNYLLAEGYPINPLSLKLGFNWFFMN